METHKVTLEEEKWDFGYYRYRVKEFFVNDIWWFIPHDYRPSELWYKLKCFLWKRHSTVKPRWLGHTWIDRGDLLAYLMFECLVSFVERESYIIEWYSDDKHSEAFQEMLRLKNWWENRYLKSDKLTTPLYDRIRNGDDWLVPIPGSSHYKMRDTTPEEMEIYSQIRDIDAQLNKELEENLISLVKLRNTLWS